MTTAFSNGFLCSGLMSNSLLAAGSSQITTLATPPSLNSHSCFLTLNTLAAAPARQRSLSLWAAIAGSSTISGALPSYMIFPLNTPSVGAVIFVLAVVGFSLLSAVGDVSDFLSVFGAGQP